MSSSVSDDESGYSASESEREYENEYTTDQSTNMERKRMRFVFVFETPEDKRFTRWYNVECDKNRMTASVPDIQKKIDKYGECRLVEIRIIDRDDQPSTW